MDTPDITIIMATYNRAHFILESLQSIQSQTYDNWECLIIDDGGSDDTLNVIAQFLKQDERFKFLKRPDTYKKGLPGCRNFGLDLAKGTYIQFFDDDDYVHPKNLETTLFVINKIQVDFCLFKKQPFSFKLPEVSFAEPNIERELSKADISNIVMNQLGMASCTVFWRSKCFKMQRFSEDLMYAEEWELYIRMIVEEDFKGVEISNILYYNRKHNLSNTGQFQKFDPVRRASKVDAILMVIKTLITFNLLTEELIEYFIKYSVKFKEFYLFSKLINLLELKNSTLFRYTLLYSKYTFLRTNYIFKQKIKVFLNYH